MSNFKLIAITPLAGCNEKFCKNLAIGKPFRFYGEYEISLNENLSAIERVDKIPTHSPGNLYSSHNGININVSAVVGKNGTGKSTIIELLYYAIYAICTKKTFNDRYILDTVLADLNGQKKRLGIDIEWLNNARELKNKLENGDKLNEGDIEFRNSAYRLPEIVALDVLKSHRLSPSQKKITSTNDFIKDVLNTAKERIGQLDWKIDIEREMENLIHKELNVSVLYEIDGRIQEICYKNGLFNHSKYTPQCIEITNDIDKFYLEDFFYTISLNYSHHSLNSITIGSWINKLFHKNDAYTTPVVINPMRDEGNFDINQELKLSRERLMSNLLYDLVHDKKTSLLNKYHVKKFIFSLKQPIKSVSIETDDTQNFSKLRSSFIFDKLKINKIDAPIHWWNYAVAYLECKLNRIDENYGSQIYKNEDSSKDPEVQFRCFINTDKTHITKKIKQVYNFLEKTFVQENRDFWNPLENEVQIDFDKDKMMQWLELFHDDLATLSPSELIEYGLPGFFNIDFLLGDDSGSEIEFSKLSSGEQQIILNTNSILYHLYNLQSVHENENNISRVAYKNVNIILDEIELYYHPEMQRTLVSELVSGFDRIKRTAVNGIEAINICILTHSPFILSDIPISNTLYLKCDGDKSVPQKNENQTFGANIHDLLANSFFLDNGFMGEFAKKKIEETIRFLNAKTNTKRIDEIVNLKLEESITKKEKSDLNEEIKYLENKNEELKRKGFNEDKEYHLSLINAIGEPIIKNKLLDMYYKAFPQEVSKEITKQEILKLAKRAGLGKNDIFEN